MFHFFWVTTYFMLQSVMSRFSVENILSPSAGTLRRGTRHCFTKFPVSKNYKDKRGGCHLSPSKTFLSHSAEKVRRGTVLCCLPESF